MRSLKPQWPGGLGSLSTVPTAPSSRNTSNKGLSGPLDLSHKWATSCTTTTIRSQICRNAWSCMLKAKVLPLSLSHALMQLISWEQERTFLHRGARYSDHISETDLGYGNVNQCNWWDSFPQLSTPGYFLKFLWQLIETRLTPLQWSVLVAVTLNAIVLIYVHIMYTKKPCHAINHCTMYVTHNYFSKRLSKAHNFQEFLMRLLYPPQKSMSFQRINS